jgi:serine protease AprX
MMTKSWLAILRIALLAAFVVGLSLPMASVRAGEVEPLFLYLQAGAFDPLTADLDIPSALTYSEAQVEQAGTYLLQLNGPVEDVTKASLEAAGALIGPYVPDYAFLVHLDAQAKANVAKLPFVRWVGPFQPAYKLAPGMDYSKRSYRVILAPWADKTAAGVGLAAFSPSLTEQADGYSAVLDEQGIQLAALRPEVIWIEPIYLQRVNNDIGAGTIMGGTTAWSRGYDGAGVGIAVADTGLDTGVIATVHSDFAGRVAHISSWPVQNTDWGCGTVLNPGANDGAADLDSGHGTHVTGSVAGNGTRSSGVIKGLAYAATINFSAIEQWTDWPASCSPYGLTDGYYLTGIPDDTRLLLAEAYGWGARVHNNSWGGGTAGVYDQQAAYFDDFLSSNRDMTVTVSAGNEGTDANDDGYVDLNSISSPGTAKNVITIGASDNERATGGYSGYTWGTAWPSDYQVPPTSTDSLSDNRNELAAFSSRGPMADGRIKPDLVAPGTNILSTKSSQTTDTGWGPYNEYYMYMGGTSMASPLSSGAAAVVRDFLISAQSIANPSSALIKATLINSAVDMSGYGNAAQEAGQPIPNMHEGWGRIDVAAATAPNVRRFTDNTAGLNTSGTATYNYNILAGTPLKVSLVWTDPEAAALASVTLVNNLNLTVTAPGGATVYKGNVFSGGWTQGNTGTADAVNNVENVYIQSPAAGIWTVTVSGANVPQGPQPFAVVVAANFQTVVYDHFTYLPQIMKALTMSAPTLNPITPNPSSGSYSLTWSPSGDTPTSYDIEEDGVVTVTAYVGTTYNYTGKPFGVHNYRVRGRFGAVPGPWSISVMVLVANAPTLNNITPNPSPNGSYGLSWAPNGDSPTSYDIEENSVVTVTAYVGTTYNYTSKPIGTYTYRVRGRYGSELGPWSTSKSVTVGTQTVVVNPGFESGRNVGWSEGSTHGWEIVVNSFPGSVTAHAGSWAAWLGGDYSDTSYVQQSITITGTAVLSYWYWVASDDICGYDYLYVKVNGTPVFTQNLCSTTNTSGWVNKKISLSAYAGQTVALRFEVYADSSVNSNLFLDDISFVASLEEELGAAPLPAASLAGSTEVRRR